MTLRKLLLPLALLWTGAVGAAAAPGVDPLLADIGAGDALRFAHLIAWARAREAWLWQEFERDRQAMLADPESVKHPMASSRFRRWFANCHGNSGDWPCEAGYWVGMRIAEAYVARALDKHAAIRELIVLRDPRAILKASGYKG